MSMSDTSPEVTQRWPCPFCQKDCKDNCIQCEICQKWIHGECAEISPTELSQLGHASTEYVCQVCDYDIALQIKVSLFYNISFTSGQRYQAIHKYSTCAVFPGPASLVPPRGVVASPILFQFAQIWWDFFKEGRVFNTTAWRKRNLVILNAHNYDLPACRIGAYQTCLLQITH